MAKVRAWLRNFFFPPAGTRMPRRVLPYATLGAFTLVLLVSGAYTWDYTNSSPFCGTTCHTMPPEYNAYRISPHARVQCVECHIGREFVGSQISRKAGDIRHVVSLAFKQYEFPINATELRPARETCEKCHFPEKFSDDKLHEIRHYGDDAKNTATSIYLALKTGGGNRRQGLGRGIHWHIEQKILYYATDREEQNIPYVRVYNDDGTVDEYTDLASGFDPRTIADSQLKEMDCITCHNRITHLVQTPEESMDTAIGRGMIDASIPEIHKQGVQVLRASYATQEQGLAGIASLEDFYRTHYADYYALNRATILSAVATIQQIYTQSVFLVQKSDWNSHPNNVGHKDFPGCFRCHDGKHLNARQQAVRLECNLCHSIPVVAGAQDFVTRLEISKGPEPQTHLNSNWIAIHRTVFDDTCSLCHKTGNPGGSDNSSFCSNSACHGTKWKYAGLDAPGLAEILRAQLPTPQPTATPQPLPTAGARLTYAANIQAIFESRCASCHGDARAAGLKLTAYADLMAGSAKGPVIVAGDAQASRLVAVQSGQHFANVSSEELAAIVEWINAGAPEK